MARVKVKKITKTSKAIKKRNIVRVKRLSNTTSNRNSVRINTRGQLLTAVPFGALAGAAGGGGGGGSSSSSVTVVPIPVDGPSQFQTAGVTDSTSKDDFKTLRNEIHEGIAGGFNALFNNYWDASPTTDWPTTTGQVPAQAAVATVMTNDVGVSQPLEVPMDISDTGLPDGELVAPQVPQGDVGGAAANITRAPLELLFRQPPAQGLRQQTEFERLMEQQRREAAQREQVQDQMAAAQNNADPRDGMVVANLRIPKRKPVQVNGVLAREAQDFITNRTTDSILNRDQSPRFVQSQYTGNAALGIYDGRASNNRYEKAGRLDAAGNAFEVTQQPLPLLAAMPAAPPVALLGGALFEDVDPDL
jgi:hypothetical protein